MKMPGRRRFRPQFTKTTKRSRRTSNGSKWSEKSKEGLTANERKHAEKMADKDIEVQKAKWEYETKNAKEITKRKLGKQGATAGSAVGVSATQNVSDIVDGGIGEDDSRKPDPIPEPEPEPKPKPKPEPKPEPSPEPWQPHYDPRG